MKSFSAAEYAAQACTLKQNVFGISFFDQHMKVVAGYAQTLAVALRADLEIVEAAAYLHDLFAVENPTRIPEHASRGAERVAALLVSQGYDDVFAQKVAQCVRTHSSPIQPSEGTVEEICISNADAMSQIARPAYWLHYAFCVKNYPFVEGVRWYRNWIRNSWAALIPQGRDAIKVEYEATVAMLARY